MPRLFWKSWHDIIQLRKDLRSGELPLHTFAADLYEVLMWSGKRPADEEPEKFFAFTFPTTTCASWYGTWCCVAGKNDKAVHGSNRLGAAVELEVPQLQEFGDIVLQFLEIKAKADVPITFRVQIELGDGRETPPDDVTEQINALLDGLKDGFRLE
jgi:hypothetical protein